VEQAKKAAVEKDELDELYDEVVEPDGSDDHETQTP
jgi:hypothetical protein